MYVQVITVEPHEHKLTGMVAVGYISLLQTNIVGTRDKPSQNVNMKNLAKKTQIVDIETVQVTEVMSSKAMEKEGCKRILDWMKVEKVPVEVCCTDCWQGMQKMISCTLVACVIIQEPQWHKQVQLQLTHSGNMYA